MKTILRKIKRIVTYVILGYLALCLVVLLVELMDGAIHPSPKSGVTNPKNEQSWQN